MKKFLFTLGLCLVLTFSLFSVFVAAQSEAATVTGDTASDEAIPQTAVENAAEANPFLLLYDRICAHLPELFSALSLLGACVIAFCYKRGLLPILKDGIGAIGSATKEWGKTAENYAKESKDICENVNDTVHFMSLCMEKMQGSLTSVEEQIDALKAEKDSCEVLKALMRGQVDMLYDIFLCSSLPQFEKERVGKRVEEMKLLLQAPTVGGDEDASE